MGQHSGEPMNSNALLRRTDGALPENGKISQVKKTEKTGVRDFHVRPVFIWLKIIALRFFDERMGVQ